MEETQQTTAAKMVITKREAELIAAALRVSSFNPHLLRITCSSREIADAASRFERTRDALTIINEDKFELVFDCIPEQEQKHEAKA